MADCLAVVKELTPSEESARDMYEYENALKKTKRRGDYWFRIADGISCGADVINGQDDGECKDGTISSY